MSLSKFHFWCQKVLPLVYDDSLSYYEVLCKVTSYLNTTIEAVNELSENITDWDTQIADLNSKYATVSSTLETLTSTVESNFNTLNDAINDLETDLVARIANNEVSITSINATIKLLQSADTTLQDEIDSINRTVINNYTTLDNKIDSLQYEIENDSALVELRLMVKELQNRIDNLTADIWNYVENKRISFDYNNWLVYQQLGNALTAQQYCQIGLTADEYAEFGLNAIEYLEFSRDMLHYDYVHTPIVGGKQSHSVALDLLANYLYQTMTADEYKQLDLSADNYAELGLSSFQYLYYPVSDTVALSPFQYMLMLNSSLSDVNEKLSQDNTTLTQSIENLTARVLALETKENNSLVVSEDGTGITAEDYSKLSYSSTSDAPISGV